MQIEYLEYFIETARCNSISAAAKKLFMSQSTLSSILQSIETNLGCPLLRRTSRGISLTDAGAEALERMQEIVSKYNELQQLGYDHAGAQRKRNICVCLYPCLCSYLAAAISPKLHTPSYQNVIFSIQEVSEKKTLSRILDGTADIAIGRCSRQELPDYQQALERSGFTLEVLYSDEPCCYVNKHSGFADRDSVHVSELSNSHLAVAQACLETYDFNRLNHITSQVAVFNSIEAIVQAISQNDFIAIIPCAALANNIYVLNGDVKRIHILNTDQDFLTFLIYRKERRSSIESVIVDDLKQILAPSAAVSSQ